MIELLNVSKSFGDNKAVSDLSLTVNSGEFYGFLGPNGAGKTTTIRMMNGLLKPDNGSLKICGVDIQQDPEAAKMKTGYVPDSPYLYEKLTAREYLEFTGGLYRLAPEKINSQIEWLFDLFGMRDWADGRCEEYSHGMRQKVVFCSAFIHDPEVLIIDEPMVGLDPQSGRLVKDLLKLYSRRGTTVFVSTHTLSLAEELCDRIGIVFNGKLISSGTIEELRQEAEAAGGNLESLFLKLTGGRRAANLPDGVKIE
ncbi:MAG: ABC transporter ATP-binding protein [Candidatus Zixiibacteriota bacterium]|nr:MAG: ABC transporter ATP-binding protein [candidate division Zixibacteria bacterium]